MSTTWNVCSRLQSHSTLLSLMVFRSVRLLKMPSQNTLLIKFKGDASCKKHCEIQPRPKIFLFQLTIKPLTQLSIHPEF